ncbi:MAG: Rab family GTPase [Promethearchaeota archaeon]|jgi:small GTP-binding protein
MSHYDYTFKILLLGDEGTGKSEFTKRYCYNIFNSSERLTIGVDFHVKTIELNKRVIKLQLWDVGGEERFRFLLPTYCLGANAAILMYDITRHSTLDNIAEWISIVRAKNGNIPIVLIGSNLHSGDSRLVSRQEGISIAENYNLSAFAEICPETGKNVEEVFEVIIELILGLRVPKSRKDIIIFKIKTPYLKINDYLELRLVNRETYIYVNGKRFIQCIRLILNIPKENVQLYNEVDSIDEAADFYTNYVFQNRIVQGPFARPLPNQEYTITPEQEFWGHCSNIQAWVDHDYDTRILMSNISFPLLMELVKAGDPKARKIFKEEIALRLETGYPSVIIFLIKQGYLDHLTEEELDTILETPKFIKSIPKWFDKFKDIPDWLSIKIKRKLLEFKENYENWELNS